MIGDIHLILIIEVKIKFLAIKLKFLSIGLAIIDKICYNNFVD